LISTKAYIARLLGLLISFRVTFNSFEYFNQLSSKAHQTAGKLILHLY